MDAFARWDLDENLHAATKTSTIWQPGARGVFAIKVLTKIYIAPRRWLLFDNLNVETEGQVVLWDEGLTKICMPPAVRQPGYKDSKRDGYGREVLTKICIPPRRWPSFDNLDIRTARGRVLWDEVLTKICMPPRRQALIDNLDIETWRGMVLSPKSCRKFACRHEDLHASLKMSIVWHSRQPGYWDGKRDREIFTKICMPPRRRVAFDNPDIETERVIALPVNVFTEISCCHEDEQYDFALTTL